MPLFLPAPAPVEFAIGLFTGKTRLATLPSDLLDDHAPAFVPGWMAQDKLDKPTSANQNQVPRLAPSI